MSTLTHLFNIFLERIMTDALEDHEGTVSTGSRTIINLRFADDIDGLAGEEEELANLVQRLDKASTAYEMEVNAVKTKKMTNNTSGINIELKVNGQELETVTSFKYLDPAVGSCGRRNQVPSGEILNVLPLKPGVGQYIAIYATLTGREFFITYFYRSGPSTCNFSKTSPDFPCVGCG